jgi:small ubiquitin-related modifier
MSDAGQQSPNGNAEPQAAPAAGGGEHLNIKVTDGNNEVFFKIKKTTKLEKLMKAFCERQGKELRSARFLFEGTKVQASDTPSDVSPGARLHPSFSFRHA